MKKPKITLNKDGTQRKKRVAFYKEQALNYVKNEKVLYKHGKTIRTFNKSSGLGADYDWSPKEGDTIVNSHAPIQDLLNLTLINPLKSNILNNLFKDSNLIKAMDNKLMIRDFAKDFFKMLNTRGFLANSPTLKKMQRDKYTSGTYEKRFIKFLKNTSKQGAEELRELMERWKG